MQLVTLNQKHEPIVSARNLHKELGIQKRFSSWFEQNTNGFVEGEDFTGVPGGTPVQGGNGSIQFLDDYAMTLDMAKHISMLSRTERGRDIRNYFIQVEKEYNSPDKIIARALLMANHKVLALETQVEEMKPKVRFADAVQASETSCLIGTLAGLITENGYKIDCSLGCERTVIFIKAEAEETTLFSGILRWDYSRLLYRLGQLQMDLHSLLGLQKSLVKGKSTL